MSSSFLRAGLVIAAATAAAVMFYVGATLPPPPLTLDGPTPATHVAGAFHVHSMRSDGSGTVDEIAAAAARAGLRFVVFTDHGDGTRAPDPPGYRHGVLCLDAVEISTDSGHVVAIGLRGATPYPLAGRSRDVVDDIHRLGGLAVLAHPDSPNSEMRWRGQNVPFDGIEWLNADSEWRDEAPRRLVGAALRSLIRPAGAIASLFDRPARTLQRWDLAAATRPVFGLAALDVHARIGWGDEGDSGGRTLLARPSYLALFKTLAQIVTLPTPLTGDAERDAELVLSALTKGRSFSIVRALAEPAPLEFQALRRDQVVAESGDRLPVTGEDTRFRARLANAPGVRLVLMHNGRPVAAGHGTLDHATAVPGVYRVEGMFPNTAVPWVTSNPIVVSADTPRDVAPPPAPSDVTSIVIPLEPAQWTVEREASSEGRMTGGADAIQFDYRLGSGEPRGQFAALVNGVRRDAGISRVQFTARANAPMRLSVQVRLPGNRDGQRWRHSAYLDTTPRVIDLRLEDFEPADMPTSRRPIAASVHALLFVVDTVNTRPGVAGTVWISDVRLAVAPPPAPAGQPPAGQ
jgi:hypothetical protein